MWEGKQLLPPDVPSFSLKWEIISTRPSHDAWIRTYILTNTFDRLLPCNLHAEPRREKEGDTELSSSATTGGTKRRNQQERERNVKMWADQVSIRHSLLLLIRFSLNNSLPSISLLPPFEYDLMSYVSSINHQFPILCSRLGSLAFYPIKRVWVFVCCMDGVKKVPYSPQAQTKPKWKGKKRNFE